MWRKSLAICLALGLSLAPSLAWSEPLPSSYSVALSQSEYDQILAALESARESLKRSNETIANQSKRLRMQSLFCAALAGALVVNGVGLIIASTR